MSASGASGVAVHLRSAVALLGTFPALAGVDLDVAAGEVVSLQGANGAGKTTLLRVCAGLVGVRRGTVEVLGHDLVRDRRAVRRQVGLLGPGSGLYDDLTVAENVRFAVRAAGGDVTLVEAALDRLSLVGRLAHTPAAKLSTGQRRRAALAVIVARNPALWLLDEPHAGLDAEGRDRLDEIVLGAARGGATVVMASHEPERARGLAGRTVTMAGGVVTPPVTVPVTPPVTPAAPAPVTPAAPAPAPAPAPAQTPAPAREAVHVA